jgi:hypothetical protein
VRCVSRALDNNILRCDSILQMSTVDSLKPLLSYIYRVWCGRDTRLFEYILNWMAHLVQRPDVWTGTALMFISPSPTIEKKVILNLLTEVMGVENVYQPASLTDDIIGKFENKHLISIIVDETWKYLFTTQDWCADARAVEKPTNFIFESREPLSLPHRFVVFHIDPEEAEQHIEETSADVLSTFLKGRDISEFDPLQNPNR